MNASFGSTGGLARRVTVAVAAVALIATVSGCDGGELNFTSGAGSSTPDETAPMAVAESMPTDEQSADVGPALPRGGTDISDPKDRAKRTGAVAINPEEAEQSGDAVEATSLGDESGDEAAQTTGPAPDSEGGSAAASGPSAGNSGATPTAVPGSPAPRSWSPPPSVGTTDATPRSPSVSRRAVRLQADVLQVTNFERKSAGCPKLTLDPELSRIATEYSSLAVRQGPSGYNSRDSSVRDLVDISGYDFAALEESVSAGWWKPGDIVRQLLRDPSQRHSIANCSVRRVGIGIVYGPNGSDPYVAQVLIPSQ